MSKNVFITGTGTDVGKTYVAALITKKLRDAGRNAGYYKAAVSGNDRDQTGKLIPSDIMYVKKIAHIKDDSDEMAPYVYEAALFPHLASKLEGNPVEMKIVKQGFENVAKRCEYVTMEGSGGILCPLRFDSEEIWLEDVVKELKLSSLLVADAGLGTINAVVLTVEYMRAKGLPVKGIIFNHAHPGNQMEEDNKKMIEYRCNIPVIASVKDGDEELDLSVERLIEFYE